jgi:dihydrofolate reductase
MRKVILFMHVSLDGFVCGPAGEQDWMTMTDDKMGEYLVSDLRKTVDSMLVGRVLYQGFASFWPAMANNKEAPPSLVEFAQWMENTPKIVFSRTLDKVEWKNSTLAKKSPEEEVRDLKKKPGGDMVIFGGAGIVSHFSKHDLVDEYRLKLEPVILGKGRPLFGEDGARRKLKLTHSREFDSGVMGLYYEVLRN